MSYGQNPYGQPPQNPYPQNPYQQNPYGQQQNPYGQTYQQNPYGQQPQQHPQHPQQQPQQPQQHPYPQQYGQQQQQQYGQQPNYGQWSQQPAGQSNQSKVPTTPVPPPAEKAPAFTTFELPVATTDFLLDWELIENVGPVFGLATRPVKADSASAVAAVQQAISSAVTMAAHLDAHAIVGLKLNVTVIGDQVEILATGTAAKGEPIDDRAECGDDDEQHDDLTQPEQFDADDKLNQEIASVGADPISGVETTAGVHQGAPQLLSEHTNPHPQGSSLLDAPATTQVTPRGTTAEHPQSMLTPQTSQQPNPNAPSGVNPGLPNSWQQNTGWEPPSRP